MNIPLWSLPYNTIVLYDYAQCVKAIILFLDTMVTSRCLVLIESAMLNCVSSFPLSKLTTDNVQLLLSILYIHLEKIPTLQCETVVSASLTLTIIFLNSP